MAERVPTYAPPMTDDGEELAASGSGHDDEPALRSWVDLFTDRDSFVPVLALAVVLVVMSPVIDLFEWGFVLEFPFSAGLVLLALDRSKVRPRTLRSAAITLAVVGVSTIVLSLLREATFSQDNLLVAINSFMFAVLFAIAFPAVVRRAFQHERVTMNSLIAAITGYLLIGIWFAATYRGIAALNGYSFFRETSQPRGGDFTYFSFLTLTTVGYGDLSPSTDIARIASITEAVIGQIYLVTAVARLVSLLGTARDRDEERRSTQ